MKQVFTTGQVARIVKVAPRTVSKWFDTGKLKGYRIPNATSGGPGDRRVPRDQLVRFLKDHGMPLGHLEQDESFGVLLAGLGADLAGRVAELLPAGDGFKVEAVEAVFDAGLALKDLKPRAVVVDLSLGRSEALRVAASVRSGEPPRRPRADGRGFYKADGPAPALLVALTYDDEADADGLKAAGFDAVLARPIDPAALAGLVGDAAIQGED